MKRIVFLAAVLALLVCWMSCALAAEASDTEAFEALE